MRFLHDQAGLHVVTLVSGPAMALPRVAGYCAAAFTMDCAFYLALTAVPYKAIKLGASPLLLGLLPAVWAVVYITGSGGLGRLSDRYSRITIARSGAVIVALSLALVAWAPRLAWLYVGMPVAAVGLSLYWPALQAALAEADHPGKLGANLGSFNVSWSTGKGVGFLIGGLVLARIGFGALFLLSVTLVVTVAILLRRIEPPSGADCDEREAENDSSQYIAPNVRRGFLWTAWVANGTAYGLSATLNYHFPRHLSQLGLGSALFGSFLGLTYLGQTLTFLVLRRTAAWHYRRWPLYLLQAAIGLVAIFLPQVQSSWGIMLMAPIVASGLGLAYYSSIYYSLHAASEPGRNTGFHEAIIGSGTLVVPPLGGALATATGALAAPFWLSGGFCLLGLGLGETLLRRAGPCARPS